ncbi:MAG TPA: enoyl-CoA hydratase/isomerase family protein [Gemmatimonadota bacterium]|nr:enoyl-CoA hydratase/isomerase family protein [Gemmatimonadota bacterium]
MADKLIEYEVKDGVAIITMVDPPANTYTHEMMVEMDEAVVRARFDEKVHVIVLTGAGEKFFSAGANINMLKQSDPYFKYYFCLHANETLNRLEQTPKLVIGALNGHTVGGGLEIAMACDLRIAKLGNSKIGLPEVSLGVLPGTGGTQRLGRMLGKSKAIELMAEGRTFGFDEALEMGLINKIFEADGFLDAVLEYAANFVPPKAASRAVGRIKRAVCSGVEVPFSEGLAIERELQQLLFQGDDAREGLAAYIEKRSPEFTGS